ncbi:MAG TPA: AbrB/MazE/SpoVT family DNA-binding domain-containing protein [Gammaproteobacteria bacterium]|nr:AbrB/MazE/SpoVT family DNA-binding domain-containing protein [Gammaproteobacteria bacterium]
MRSTLTSRGQTVVPAEIRRKFHLTQSDRLEWVIENNILRVIPVRQNPVDEFRGSGEGGTVIRLLADRGKDRDSE